MAKPKQKRRTATFFTYKAIELGLTPLVIRGYDQDRNAVCRLLITRAGIEFFRGKKQVANLNWEQLIEKVDREK